MWKCSLGPPAFEQNNHHAEKVQVGIPPCGILRDWASRWLTGPMLGSVELEEGVSVEGEESVHQVSVPRVRTWGKGEIYV